MSLDLKTNFPQINLSRVKTSKYSNYVFEDFLLDVEHLMLYRNGAEVSLTPKQVETLLALIEKHGQIVSKEALMARLWGNATVEESNLIQNIHVLRKVLSETAAGKPMIETLRRRGYRFNGRVSPNGHESAGAIGESEVARPSTAMTRDLAPVTDPSPVAETKGIARLQAKRALRVIAAVAIAVLGVVGGYLSYNSTPSLSGEKKLFAVLPIRPLDSMNRSDLYEFGIADALINRINSIDGFQARPLIATRNYAEIDQDPVTAGREQKVGYVVASNYQIANGRIRVTTQLWDVATGKVENTFNVETDLVNIFSAQDAIANEISSKLLARFGSDPVEFQAKHGTDNEEAYQLYLRAMNLSEERGLQNVRKSLEHLERAVALDPKYALAWAAKALIHVDMVSHTGGGQHEHFPKSLEAIKRALDIDPNLSDAYSALCHHKNRYEYDFAGAEAACKRAVSLDPNSSVAHKTNANFLYSRGRFDEAISEIKTAIGLQPVSYRNQQIYALALYYARRYPEAEAQFKMLIELNPNQITFIQGRLIKVLEEQRKESEAFEYLVKMLTIQKTDNSELERLKTAYRTSGWRGALTEQIKIAEANGSSSHFQLACLYAKIGDKDKAFENLEKAYRERSFQIPILQVEPQLDPLHDDPRFADLVRRIEGK